MNHKYDCSPTLTDTDVLEFCKNGYLILEGVVPDEINQRVFEYCEEHEGTVPAAEDWYIENVTLNEQVAGAVRSVLGKNFTYQTALSSTRVECPVTTVGGWHNDGGSSYGVELDCLQVFYYPQDTPKELGPTAVLPGSHFLFSLQRWMAHYGGIQGGVVTAAPAGSIFLTVYRIWHRRTASTATGVRNMVKYWYTRTVPPERDWIREAGFEPQRAKSSPPGQYFHREAHRTINDAAEMFYWLCGLQEEYDAVKDTNLPVFWR